MNVQQVCYQRVEEYFADLPGTDSDLLQLTPGALNFHSTRIDLDGVWLEWNRTGAAIRSRDINHGQGVMFGFVRESPKRVMLGGMPLDYGSAVLWFPGREVDYVAPAGLASLIVQVNETIVQQLGWSLSASIVNAVPRVRLQVLENSCWLATQAACSGLANSTPAVTAATTAWRERILAALEPALAPWLGPVAPSAGQGGARTRRWLVKDADRWFEQQDSVRVPPVDDCATALGVSRRTLFRAFREELGIGPQGYLQLVRLHQLRNRLLMASPTSESVTALASQLGFTHMGRLSAAYQKHFGEYPKQTLRRQ